MENDPNPIKLVFLGDPAVGKTSFLRRFSNGHFTEEDDLLVYDFSEWITVDGLRYHVIFWDLDGALGERLRPLAYPGTSMFMLCFDVTNPASFKNIKDSWITEIRRFQDTPFLIIGNKMDLREKNSIPHSHLSVSNMVPAQEAWELARLHGTSYVENSAVTGEQVSEVVTTAIRMIADDRRKKSRCRCKYRFFKWIKGKHHNHK